MTSPNPNPSRGAQGTIYWNKPKLARFKDAYSIALARQQDVFTFEDGGQSYQLYTQYARYLIEYLESLPLNPA